MSRDPYLAKAEKWRKNSDGAHELAMSRLNEAGGKMWRDSLCSFDILHITVKAVRDYDRKRR